MYMPLEIDLCRTLIADLVCSELEIGASMGANLGVLVLLRGRPKGMWIEKAGGLSYQSLAEPKTNRWADTVESAVAETISMAKANRW